MLSNIFVVTTPDSRFAALILNGDFYTASVLSSTLTKLVLRFNQITSDERAAHALRAEVRSISFLALPERLVNLVHTWPQAMLTMTSIIRVGQSKFVSVPIDEDSQERIFNCIRMLSEMSTSKSIDEIFLMDTKAAYAKMVATEEVGLQFYHCGWVCTDDDKHREKQRRKGKRSRRLRLSRPMTYSCSANFRKRVWRTGLKM